MRFRLFGVDVEIHVSFWITSAVLGLNRASLQETPRGAVLVWVAVVLVSVLVHEYGHALAMRRHGIEPTITLYALGGLTHNRSGVPLRRLDQVIISLAGPFAGFALGGLAAAVYFTPRVYDGLPMLGQFAVDRLLWVNFGWGVINLMPVLPLDGGQVLAHALGPKRAQLAAAISTLVGFLVASLFVYLGAVWGALIFGLAAIQSYLRFTGAPAEQTPAAEPTPGVTPPELTALIRSAKDALAEGDLDRAAWLAQRVLEGGDAPSDDAFAPKRRGTPTVIPPAARREALEVIAWVHLLAGRPETAAEVLTEARRFGKPDASVEGAVLFARRDFEAARRVLEAARAAGDDRKQIVGPLVQILIAQGEVGAAAAQALSVIDDLSDDDARRMAALAGEHGAFAAAARLYEAMFDRRHQPEDAYEAARAEAQGGQPDRALDLLRRAVEAGFSDRARAWSDAALASLRAGSLEAVLPPP